MPIKYLLLEVTPQTFQNLSIKLGSSAWFLGIILAGIVSTNLSNISNYIFDNYFTNKELVWMILNLTIIMMVACLGVAAILPLTYER